MGNLTQVFDGEMVSHAIIMDVAKSSDRLSRDPLCINQNMVSPIGCYLLFAAF